MSSDAERPDTGTSGIAVVGMAGRFPGAPSVERFWEILAAGRETITFWSVEELEAAGVEPRLLHDPAYVRARGLIEGPELFDAAFFGLSPREAEIMDPQHRLLLECAWQALEHAGYDAQRYPGPVGVFAGTGSNTYLLWNLLSNRELLDAVGLYQAMLGSDSDFLATRISYKLNLKGPSLTVQTACSTSLVAVHLACQSLLNGECDMALAGGVRIAVPQRAGYLYQAGGIFSPDGHCRPFDAQAKGCLDGDGVGVVVLKRLADALADGDHVHAVIRGSAINNDGALKIGYTAPSVHGQEEVIAMAQALAEVAPETLGYVEAHGTATPMGDPIEVAALAQVFGSVGGGKTCALGSVKGNIGHLDAAAGVAGLIKTVLALERRQIPPSLHFERPNPQIPFDETPFYVNARLADWPRGETPRRAGVSSFGIGGTNAHVVLEEAPEPEPGSASRPRQLLLLSAATASALEARTADLVAHLREYLEEDAEEDLADLAYTLQVGRRVLPHRRIVVVDSVPDAISALDALDPKRVLSRLQEEETRGVAFLFPGQGSQYPGMAAELYETEPVFRREVDRAAEILRPVLGLDLRQALADERPDAAQRLTQTALAQPALFVVEHALARLWMDWGVKPEALLGHSVGEWVAACLSGVFSLEEALLLVAERGRLMQEAAPGAMLSVSAAEEQVRLLLAEGVEIAAVNTPALSVVAGPEPAVEATAARLAEQGIPCRRLHTSHAFHTASMEPAAERFRQAVARVRPRPPQIPFLSNRTGTWIHPEEAMDPAYWAGHLRHPVRFSEGLEKLFGKSGTVLLEVGPGRALASLARQHPDRSTAQVVLSSLPAARESGGEVASILRSLGQLWLAGVEVDWGGFYAGETRRRLALPTYPFERQRFWVEPRAGAGLGQARIAPGPGERQDLADWFYAPLWRQALPLPPAAPQAEETWWIFSDEGGLGARLGERLREHGIAVVTVRPGEGFEETGKRVFTVRPENPDDFRALFDRLTGEGLSPRRIAHLWSLGPAPASWEEGLERRLDLGFHSLVALGQALGQRPGEEPVHVTILSTGLQRVTGEEALDPLQATLLGPALTLPLEIPGVTCQSLDLTLPEPGSRRERELLDLVLTEVAAAEPEPIVALRAGGRWLRAFEPLRLPPPTGGLPLRDEGVYLVTGGLGGVGLELAEWLARSVARPRIVLTRRSKVPAREGRLLHLEELGAQVEVLAADVTDREAMAEALDGIRRRHGRLHGVIHAAGLPGGGLIQLKTREAADAVLAPKVRGALVLADLLASEDLDFLVYCSSLNSILGGPGQVDYTAANAFLDALAEAESLATGRRVLAIAWDAWRGLGMAAGPKPTETTEPEPPRAELLPFDHPLLTQRAVAGDSGTAAGEEVFVGYLEPALTWILAEHRLGGHAIVPGTTYLEMAGAAFRSLSGNAGNGEAAATSIELRDVLFVAPMRVADGERREVRTVLRKNGDGFHFHVRSGGGPEEGWQEHVVGAIGKTATEPARFDLPALLAGRTEQAMGEEYQEDLRQVGLGPRWESLKRVYVGEEGVVGLLELAPEFSSDLEQFALHPALLDIATSFGEAFAPRGEGYYLPLSYRRLQVHGRLPRKVWSYARFQNGERASTETLAFDIAILDEEGVERVHVEEFTLKRIDVAGAIRARAGRGETGNAEDAEREPAAQSGPGMDAAEGVETFRRILAGSRLPRIAVSTHPLAAVIAEARAQTVAELTRGGRPAPGGGHARPELDTAYVAPRSDLEHRLAALWQEILGIDRVGVFDDFFELGGHSLLGTQLVSRLRSDLAVEVPLARLFEAATVAELSAVVETLQAKTGPAAPGERPGEPGPETLPLVAVPRAGAAPLSSAQQRLWFLDRLEPGSAAYNVPRGLWLRGTLDSRDRAALAASFTEIARRHETLRTTFREVEGEPAQVVAPPAQVPLPFVDLDGLSERERQAETWRLAREAARQPFDLSRGPLLRILLVRLNAREHLLSVVMHHIITDGWSMGLFVRETWALFPAFRTGRPSPLPELPLQYGDFALWQRQWLGSSLVAPQLDYWRKQLADAPEELNLPLDRPRPAVESFRGAIATFAFLPEIARQVIAFTRRHGATSAMTLLAGFQALLARWSGQGDVSVGAPIAGRNRREIEGLIGFFVNTLVFRADLSGPVTFGALLDQVRQTSLAAYAHQDLPFERLVEELHPTRTLRRPPLFQVMFGFETLSPQALTLPGLAASPLEEEAIDTGTSKFDLTMSAFEQDGALAGVLEYNAGLLEPATIGRFLGHFETLLARAVSELEPGLPLREIEILSPAERAQIAAEWNDTAAPAPPLPSVLAFFEAQAERTPEVVAVEMGDEALSYGELEARANRLARYLTSLGVGPESPVGLCLERSLDLPTAVLAVWKARGAYVPLDPSYPPERLRLMIEDARPAALLLKAASEPPGLDPGVTPILRLDRDRQAIASQNAERPRPPRHPESLAYILYTSGSTGRPKGIAMPHRPLANLVGWQVAANTYPFRTLQFASLAFDVSVQEMFASWAVGATVVMVDQEVRRDAPALVRLLSERRVERIFLPFVVLQHLAEAALYAGAPDALREVITAGEQLRTAGVITEFFQRLPGCRLENQYGPSEAHVVTAFPLSGPPETWAPLPPVGRPLANLQIFLQAASEGAPGALVPVGAPGEVMVAGAGLSRGYLGRPDLTAERFLPHPLGEPGARAYRTGDLGRYRSEGTIEYAGRIDHQVKVRGFRIELGEVEAALGAHPGVRQALVLSKAGKGRDPRLVAYVVPDPDTPPTAAELAAYLGSSLPEYMVPSSFVLLPALPLDPNGKVDRRALPEPGELPRQEGTWIAPRTPAEEILAAIWGDVLDLPRVSPEDDFFALGGHSLLATRAASRLRQAFGIEVPLRLFFEAPKLSELALRIAALTRSPGAAALPPPIVPVPREGPLPLSFAQQRLWFIDQLETGNAAYNIATALLALGDFSAPIFARTLSELVRRHESLRTVFRFGAAGEEPGQAILPPGPVPLPAIDLAALGAPAREGEVRRLAAAEAGRGFDLAAGPLLRATLLVEGPERRVVLFTLHHIVCDAWSIDVLVREVSALYAAFREGRPSPLPELPVQYADFAVWQRRWLAGEVLAAQLGWWRERLAGAPALLDLPTDRPRPPVQSFRGAGERLLFDDELAQALRALSRRQGATLFMTFLAAFTALLSRYSGQRDLNVGTPIAGRTQREVEGLIGFFVNTLVLRHDVSGDPGFAALLDRARRELLSAHAHQDLPFERLVLALEPERSLSHEPFFQVMADFLILPGDEALAQPGLSWRTLETAQELVHFDFILTGFEGEAGLGVDLEYRTDLFDRASVSRTLGHLLTLLGEAVREPGRRLSELPLLTAPERQELLAGWERRSAAAGPCLHQRFAEQARRAPGAPALVMGVDSLTYGELDRQADRLARALRARGVGPEVVAGVCLERSLSLGVAILGVLKAGGAYLPLDPAYPRERLAYLLEDAAVRVIVTERQLAGSLPETAAEIVFLDDAAEWEGLPGPPDSGVTPENLAYVIYTSGSTGRPRGVQVTHANVGRLLSATDAWFGFGPGDVWTLFHSFAFDFSVWEIWGALAYGGSLVVVPYWVSRSPESFLELLADERVTVLNQTPSAFRQLIRAEGEAGGRRERALRLVIFGGEALELQSLRPWVDRHGDARPRLVNMYGITETTVHVTYRPLTAADVQGGAASVVGRAIPDLAVRVLDPGLEPQPVGVPGELCVAGAGLARGYLGRPELTAERFIPDPWEDAPGSRLYRSGDLARRLADGDVEYLGRLDDQVKIRGFRIEPGEVEAALLAASCEPRVREAVVVARQDAPGDRRLVAYVVGGPGPGPLREALARALPEPLVPSAIVTLDALPLTVNGKVDRRALPAPQSVRQEGAAPELSWPENPIEEVLAGIWAEVLHLPRVGRDDSFFELGGHSLLASQAVARVRQAFGVELPLRDLFQHSTVAGLAERVAAARGQRFEVDPRSGPPLVATTRRGEPHPLSYPQLRLLSRRGKGRSDANTPFGARFSGPLDAAVLARSLAAIVDRHDILRSAFPEIDGETVQVVRDDYRLAMMRIDLSGLPAARREEELKSICRLLGAYPFDLAAEILFRATLIRLAPDDHVLVVVEHHIVHDGWSQGVLAAELSALYTAFAKGEPSPLPELPLQYADFAVWQRAWIASQGMDELLRPWQERLRDMPVQDFPTDRPRPAVRSLRGGILYRRLDAEVGRRVRELGRRSDATLFMTLLAVWKVLLWRWTGREDIALTTNAAGRSRIELEGLLGFFTTIVPLRTDLSGDPTFRELLGRVRETTLYGFEHQDVPFTEVLGRLFSGRIHNEVFPLGFFLQNFPVHPDPIPGLSVRYLEDLVTGNAVRDLTLLTDEEGEEIGVRLEYRKDILDEKTVQWLLDSFTALTAEVARDPELRLSALGGMLPAAAGRS